MEPQLERYSRQIFFPHVGEEGQKKLLSSYAIVVGCGALGTVAASMLVRSGVGKILIIDRDFIEENNLQRQILFDENDIKEGLPKAIAAEQKLRKINSKIEISSRVADVSFDNVESLIEGADIVVDGLDNFETRFLLNDACVKKGIPWIYGACIGSYGITMNVIPKKTPCVRCVFEVAPPPGLAPTCETAGILASVPHIIASIEVTEALKYLMGKEEAMNKHITQVDVWDGTFKTLSLSGYREKSQCPTCVKGVFEFLEPEDKERMTHTMSLCGRNAVQVSKRTGYLVRFEELAQTLQTLGKVEFNRFMLKFNVDEFEFTVFPDGRAIIKGTNDTLKAKILYSKYIGN